MRPRIGPAAPCAPRIGPVAQCMPRIGPAALIDHLHRTIA
jgi:hypothetical protein